MPVLITLALLLGTAAALAVLRAVRPRFRFGWLLTISLTIAAWLSVLVWLPQLPISLSIPLWKSATTGSSFATLAVNDQNWPYAFSIVTLALAILLTAPARANFPNPSSWMLCLATASLGVLAFAAQSPLTLVLFWAGFDLAEAGLVLARSESLSSSGRVGFAFSVRLGSMALILLALVLREASAALTGPGANLEPSAALLCGAALLRLTAFSTAWTKGSLVLGRDEVGIALQLAAGASAVAFLSQLSPDAPANPGWLLGLCAMAALYAGWMWLRAPDRFAGRSLWIMATGCLAVAAAVQGNPIGAASWGCAMLLAGGALFLRAFHERWMNRGLLVGVWLSSSLPFSLTATAWAGDALANWATPILLAAQALMIAGFHHFASNSESEPMPRVQVTSLKGVYRLGLILPLSIGILLGIWGWSAAFNVGSPIVAAVVVTSAAALAWAKKRLTSLNPDSTNWVPLGLQGILAWVRGAAARLERSLQRVAEAFTRTIEGEAGIMWSLLLLVLFVSLIVGREQ